MSVTTHDLLEFVAGDTWQLNAQLLDAGGLPMDLSFVTINWLLDDVRGHRNVLSRSTGGSGIVVTDAPGGLCTVTVAATDTAGIEPGTYRDQCRVTSSDQKVSVEWQGYIVVKRNNMP